MLQSPVIRMFGNILICAAIWYGYSFAVSRVHLKQQAVSIDAKVIETEKTAKDTYIRIEYVYKDTQYKKSFRTEEPDKYRLHSTVSIKIMPGNPQSPFIDLKQERLADDVYYIMTILLAYLIYRAVRIMYYSYTPNS